MPLSPRFDDALALACQLHRQQVRKGSNVPYLGHLLIVAGLVIDHGGDEDTAIAAVLHDAVEDQGGQPTLDLIRQRFGDRVADLVAQVTDAIPVPGAPKPDWRTRKLAYLEHLSSAPAEALLISAADKVHNARAIVADLRQHGEAVWSRFKGGKAGTLWYYRQLTLCFDRPAPTPAPGRAFGAGPGPAPGPAPGPGLRMLARELREAVHQMEQEAEAH